MNKADLHATIDLSNTILSADTTLSNEWQGPNQIWAKAGTYND